MITKDIGIPGAPFEIERMWIDDGHLFYTRRGDSRSTLGRTVAA